MAARVSGGSPNGDSRTTLTNLRQNSATNARSATAAASVRATATASSTTRSATASCDVSAPVTHRGPPGPLHSTPSSLVQSREPPTRVARKRPRWEARHVLEQSRGSMPRVSSTPCSGASTTRRAIWATQARSGKNSSPKGCSGHSDASWTSCAKRTPGQRHDPRRSSRLPRGSGPVQGGTAPAADGGGRGRTGALRRQTGDEVNLSDALKLVARLTDEESPAERWTLPEKVLIRTVTHYHVGRVVDVTGDWIVLDEASWVASTGRFSSAL